MNFVCILRLIYYFDVKRSELVIVWELRAIIQNKCYVLLLLSLPAYRVSSRTHTQKDHTYTFVILIDTLRN